MFREFSEIPEEANLDSVERLKDKYQLEHLSVKESILAVCGILIDWMKSG